MRSVYNIRLAAIRCYAPHNDVAHSIRSDAMFAHSLGEIIIHEVNIISFHPPLAAVDVSSVNAAAAVNLNAIS